MNLGERIYKLRTEKNLSQVDLADLLDVSRQSISKWETDGSVPELDKLVKLSEIFGVSLDELILDKKQSAEPEEKEICQERENAQPGKRQRIVGVVLLCLAAIMWQYLCFTRYFLWAPLFAAVIAAFGVICLRVRKFAGLWCAWVGYAVAELFLRDKYNISLDSVFFDPQLYKENEAPLFHYAELYNLSGTQRLLAWLLLLAFCSMIVVTFRCLYKAYSGSLRRDGIWAACLWAGHLFVRMPFEKVAYNEYYTDMIGYSPNSCAVLYLTWRNLLFAFALVFTARLLVALWRKYKNKN